MGGGILSKVGFTLIELLAVIVILAIIALISTPTIIGVIEKARKGAFEDSAYGVLDAGRVYFVDKLADSNSFTGASFTFPEGGDLKISGEKPAGGTISLNENGEQALALFDKDKKWCAYKGYGSEKIEISEYKNSRCTTYTPAKIVGIAKDLSAKKNDGIIYGDSTIDSSGITFHGKGFVDAGNAKEDFSKGVTFVTRFKVNQVGKENQGIIGNWDVSGGGILVESGTNQPYGILYMNDSGYQRATSDKIPLGQYTTVVFSYDKSKITIYRNGIKIAETPVTGSVMNSALAIYIGSNPQTDEKWYESSQATVTDALVLTRGVTDSEVQNYFKDQISIFQDPSVLFQYKW